MARHETDREDLMREAVALCERVEIRLDTPPRVLVAGWRDDGRLSLYFDADPVYHFDAEGGLRRAFVAGHLYRSRGDTLSRLSRLRAEGESSLVRHDLNAAELQVFLDTMAAHLATLAQALDSSRFEVIRQIPPGANLPCRLSEALAGLDPSRLAAALIRRQ